MPDVLLVMYVVEQLVVLGDGRLLLYAQLGVVNFRLFRYYSRIYGLSQRRVGVGNARRASRAVTS